MNVQLTGHEIEQFVTSRLVARRLLPADLDFLTALHAEAAVMATRGGVRSAASTEPFVRSNVAHWRRYQFGLYVISLADNPDEPIGRAGLRWTGHPRPSPWAETDGTESPAVDLSVILVPSVWEQGLGTEAAQALLAIGDRLGLPIVAGCEHDHWPAVSLATRVGLIRAGGYTHHNRPWVRFRWPAGGAPPVAIDTGDNEEQR